LGAATAPPLQPDNQDSPGFKFTSMTPELDEALIDIGQDPDMKSGESIRYARRAVLLGTPRAPIAPMLENPNRYVGVALQISEEMVAIGYLSLKYTAAPGDTTYYGEHYASVYARQTHNPTRMTLGVVEATKQYIGLTGPDLMPETFLPTHTRIIDHSVPTGDMNNAIPLIR
jgi:hypothetical protein